MLCKVLPILGNSTDPNFRIFFIFLPGNVDDISKDSADATDALM